MSQLSEQLAKIYVGRAKNVDPQIKNPSSGGYFNSALNFNLNASSQKNDFSIKLHDGDLENLDDYPPGQAVAIDTEATGLDYNRDEPCYIQLSNGKGQCDLIYVYDSFNTPGDKTTKAPNLMEILLDNDRLKLMHFARFDIAQCYRYTGALVTSVWCSKIASRIFRTYSDKHGLSVLVQELLSINLNKSIQSSDWTRSDLSEQQKLYACADVCYLHALCYEMYNSGRRLSSAGFSFDSTQTSGGNQALDDSMSKRRYFIEHACGMLPFRVALDMFGFSDDIWAH